MEDSKITSHQVPVLTQARFAQLVGVSSDVVRGWVARGQVPTVKIGRYRMVNVAKLRDEAA